MAKKKWLRPLREAFEAALDALLFPFQRSHRDRVPFSEWLSEIQVHELDGWRGKDRRHANFLNLKESVRLMGLTAKELKRGKVLDVGAGPRSAVCYVKGNKAAWLALDPLAPDYAREKILEKSPAKYLSGVAEKLPFKDASLDAIVCINSMDHMIHPAASAQEFGRVVKKGGRVYLSVELFNHFRSRKRWYKDCHPYDFSQEFIAGLFKDFRVERSQVYREGGKQQLNAVYVKG